jgi:hypothetical protein
VTQVTIFLHGPDAPKPPAPACADAPLVLFFPADGERRESWEARERLALALCAACPIRAACLDQALRFPIAEQHGVQGGLTADERRAEIRNRVRREQRADRKVVSAAQGVHVSTSAQSGRAA